MPKSALSRRFILTAGAASVVGGAVFAGRWFNVLGDATANGALTVEHAQEQAASGAVLLIDIRRPDEWERTGVAQNAIALDMRRDDFEVVLRGFLDSHGTKPVALICARGVRSDRMNQRLMAAGFEDILDVPEGMLGSGAGPGWIARGLPLRAPTPDEMSGL